MGCVSSTLLNQDEELSQIGFSHHIVSLTSTTYGLLTTLDNHTAAATTTAPPTQSTPPPRTTLGSLFPSPILSEPRVLKHSHQQQREEVNNKQEKQAAFETINSWDLMYGLDSDHIPSFRFNILPPKKTNRDSSVCNDVPQLSDENVDPNTNSCDDAVKSYLERFEPLCPPNGEDRVVMYSTSLRGVRKTFEDCNAVRSAIHGLGIVVCERDISMDRGFRDELRDLMKGKAKDALIPPRVFVKGRYIGGVDEMMRIVEEGRVWELVKGLPKLTSSTGCATCEGCGGVGFLPCFTCHGSCKLVVEEGIDEFGKKKKDLVLRCGDCNENGLVLCPICS